MNKKVRQQAGRPGTKQAVTPFGWSLLTDFYFPLISHFPRSSHYMTNIDFPLIKVKKKF